MYKTYAPKVVRICTEHIKNLNLKSGLELLSNNQPLTLGHNNDEYILLMLTEIIKKGKSHSSSELLTNEECKIWTGWSREHIDAMAYYVNWHNTAVRSKCMALLIFSN